MFLMFSGVFLLVPLPINLTGPPLNPVLSFKILFSGILLGAILHRSNEAALEHCYGHRFGWTGLDFALILKDCLAIRWDRLE